MVVVGGRWLGGFIESRLEWSGLSYAYATLLLYATLGFYEFSYVIISCYLCRCIAPRRELLVYLMSIYLFLSPNLQTYIYVTLILVSHTKRITGHGECAIKQRRSSKAKQRGEA